MGTGSWPPLAVPGPVLTLGWLVAVAALLDIPFISSGAATFNSLHFGVKSGSHPESNLCLPEQAVVTFPIKM